MSDASSDNFIRYECRDRIATITFNRPEKLNAFNDAMVMRLANVLHQFDIDENAKKLKFVETDPAQLVRSLDDLDVAVINGNYALEANLSPSKDAILVEEAEGNPYANFLAVQAGDKDNAALTKLDELLHSPEVKAYIEKTWSDGSVLPAT